MYLRHVLSIFCLAGGQSFPTDVNPTSSARKETCHTSTKSAEKARDGRQLSGTGKRSQADIQKKIADEEDEPYRPPPGSMFDVFAISFRNVVLHTFLHVC
mgnify:CR=1 FL=1